MVRTVELPASPRHLGLAGPGGPVLVPVERGDALVQVGLPGGEVLSETPVGEFPHDAAAARTGGSSSPTSSVTPSRSQGTASSVTFANGSSTTRSRPSSVGDPIEKVVARK